jgi:hypothetical protein
MNYFGVVRVAFLCVGVGASLSSLVALVHLAYSNSLAITGSSTAWDQWSPNSQISRTFAAVLQTRSNIFLGAAPLWRSVADTPSVHSFLPIV